MGDGIRQPGDVTKELTYARSGLFLNTCGPGFDSRRLQNHQTLYGGSLLPGVVNPVVIWPGPLRGAGFSRLPGGTKMPG